MWHALPLVRCDDTAGVIFAPSSCCRVSGHTDQVTPLWKHFFSWLGFCSSSLVSLSFKPFIHLPPFFLSTQLVSKMLTVKTLLIRRRVSQQRTKEDNESVVECVSSQAAFLCVLLTCTDVVEVRKMSYFLSLLSWPPFTCSYSSLLFLSSCL